MSKVCRNCQAEISWDIKKREELNYKGPLNPDKTPHKCYGKVLEKFENIEDNSSKNIEYDKVPQRPPMTDTPRPTASVPITDPTLIQTLAQLTDALRLHTLALLASTQEERESIRKQVLAQ